MRGRVHRPAGRRGGPGAEPCRLTQHERAGRAVGGRENYRGHLKTPEIAFLLKYGSPYTVMNIEVQTTWGLNS
ncbi:hypothetical protein Pd630_LPD03636 [Rhodococcus opacus PD630]|nr:hypothetical protein Pd630_LPD03636 [Rhodococcus opacus PD630]